MEITTRISKITYYKKETGYCILTTTINHQDYLDLHEKYQLIGNKITCVGIIERQPYVDEVYTFIGNFVKDANYGLQFKFTSFKRSTINSKEALIDYLSSDLFEGIGIVKASSIVDTLGLDAIDLIIEDKNVLKRVPKLKQKEIDSIYQTIKDNIINQDAFMFFIQNGLSLDLSKKIIDVCGSDALPSIQENPYQLIKKIEYFGFSKCDKFALTIGISPHSYNRLSALIVYILQDTIYKNGNSYCDKTELHSAINRYLANDYLTKEQFSDLLKNAINDKLILEQNDLIFDYQMYHKEQKLAEYVVEKLKNETSYKLTNLQSAYDAISKEINIILTAEQRKAVFEAFLNPLSIITGGPGTGKSTIIKVILALYVKLHKNQENSLLGVKLLAPTGKASKRLVEITNFEATTIHRYLGFNGFNFEYGPYNQTDDQFIIVDEASMMDLPLAYQLFAGTQKKCQVVIVGDVDQLPSVGPGQVLKDLIDTKEITTTRLKKIHRQGANSKIIDLAHSINDGVLPEDLMENYPDRTFISCPSEQVASETKQVMAQLMDQGIDIVSDVQVLAPMYRTVGGINELNNTIQALYNKEERQINFHFQAFKIGDKVIQLVNRVDKKIMNGDIGIIDDFVIKFDKITNVIIKYDTGKVLYNIDELEEISLAYAISVHKSQGSEFPIIVLPISSYYAFMLKRKLIYTAITRAKQQLIIIGDPYYLNRGISYIENPRQTVLKEMIFKYLNNEKEHLTIDDALSNEYIEKKKDDISPYDFESIIGEEEYDI